VGLFKPSLDVSEAVVRHRQLGVVTCQRPQELWLAQHTRTLFIGALPACSIHKALVRQNP